MKQCPGCKEFKPLTDFTARGYTCKTCHNLRSKSSYKKNKQPYIERARKFRQTQICRIKAYLNELKSFGCSQCDEKRFWCIDFHHLNASEKDYAISDLLSFGSIHKIVKELNKCVMLCKNCHADTHFKMKYTGVPERSPKP